MSIQIFGTKKCFDTKKAERWFKERGLKYQFIDMKEKGMSRGEFDSVVRALGGVDKLISEKSKDKDLLALMKYLTDDDRTEKLFENQQLISTPVVRSGKKAVIGFLPEVWKDWE